MSNYVKIKIETLVDLQNDLEHYRDLAEQLKDIRNDLLADEESYKRVRTLFLENPELYND